ncbi:MAG: hypothetical protein ABI439_04965 [Rhodospirillales bacterium]
MRILVAFAHYYKYDGIGYHSSRGNDPAPRCIILYSANKPPNTGYRSPGQPVTIAAR